MTSSSNINTSSNSYSTTQLAVGAAITLALAAAVYFVLTPDANKQAQKASQALETKVSSSSKRKRKAVNADKDSTPKIIVQDEEREKTPVASLPPKQPATIPGGFGPVSDIAASDSGLSSSAKKNKKKKAKKPALPQEQLKPQQPSQLQSEVPYLDANDWTKVNYKKKKAGSGVENMSDTGVTTSVTEEDGSVTDSAAQEAPLQTWAERTLPKPAKTGVDDMLLDQPKETIARVMKIPDRSHTITLADYEDARDPKAQDADDEEGWEVPKSRKRNPREASSSSNLSPSGSLATQTAAPGNLTKKQRQNARKRELEKEAKAMTEAERAKTEQKHRQAAQEARLREQAKTTKPSSPGAGSRNIGGSSIWDP